jgi:dihydrofolate synthase/folylpolyglutamate synthase
MDVPAPAISAGIAAARWPGRLERVSTNPAIILDGAHNPAGARALGYYIREFFANESIRIVFGAMRDKAVEEVTNTLFPLAAEIILTAPDQPRALHPEALMEAAGGVNGASVRVAESVREALAMVAEMDERKPMTTFVTGSLFLVGEARAFYMTRDGG